MEHVPFIIHRDRPFFLEPVDSWMGLFPLPSPIDVCFLSNLIRLLLPVKVAASLIAALRTAFSPCRTCTAILIR